MKLFNFYKGTEIHLGVMDENGTARDATAGGYPAIPATMQSAIDGTYTLDAIRTAAGNGLRFFLFLHPYAAAAKPRNGSGHNGPAF